MICERSLAGQVDSETTGLEISRLLEKYCLRLCDDDKNEVTN